MYIESVPNPNSPPAILILLRESYREDGKVRKRTLCNLSQWPAAYIEGLRGVPRVGIVIAPERDAFTVTRSLPHGHVAATLGTARKIGLDRLLGPEGSRCRDLVLALIVVRILEPCSKLATAQNPPRRTILTTPAFDPPEAWSNHRAALRPDSSSTATARRGGQGMQPPTARAPARVPWPPRAPWQTSS